MKKTTNLAMLTAEFFAHLNFFNVMCYTTVVAYYVSFLLLFSGGASGVVAMSGTAVSQGAIDDKPANTVEEIAEQQGCPTVNVITMIKCLQNAPAENIIRVIYTIEQQNQYAVIICTFHRVILN